MYMYVYIYICMHIYVYIYTCINHVYMYTCIYQTRIPFLDIMINKSGTEIWMDIYNKSTDSKRYVPFTSKHPQHCLTKN